LVSDPHRSVVLRTLWRVRDVKISPGLGRNRRPDFQELLSDLRLSIWVRQGADERATPQLVVRLDAAIKRPTAIYRFGGLSLGESTHLVDALRPWREEDPKAGHLMLQDDQGDLNLPIWPDHVGSQGTRWGQFKLEETLIDPQPQDQAWIAICPPGLNA
jgi:CRISPR-associated protein Cas5t